MANEAQTIEERLAYLEQRIEELSSAEDDRMNEAGIDFWRLQNLEANVNNLLVGQQADLIDEESFDGIDPILPASVDEEGDTKYDEPFDLDNLATDTFSIKENKALSGGLWIYGVKITSISDGAGMTWDAANSEWDASAVSADAYVILTLETLTPGATISVSATLADGDEDTQIWPLWFLPWDGSNSRIDSTGIIDLRGAVKLPGFS